MATQFQPLADRKILRRIQVEAWTGLSRSTIYARIKSGTFPAPIALGGRAVGWDSRAIEQWIDERVAAGEAEWRARRSDASQRQG